MTVRMISRLVGVLALSAATSAWMGCSSTPENENAGGKTGSEFNEGNTPRGDTSDQMGGKLAGFETVYFEYDKADIREDARASLRKNADKLNAGNLGVVTVEGHCDERGSTEYNLALGKRRADAAYKYLVDLGVESSRMTTISYGEEKPAVEGHNELAWAKNRRDEFQAR